MRKRKSQERISSREDAAEKISEMDDWRSAMLGQIRAVVMGSDSEIVEEVKWRKPSNPAGVPVWSREGLICTGETYKKAVKMTFANGAALEDPSGLFNASREGNVRRAIDFHEGDKINKKALKALVRAAVALNQSKKSAKAPKKASANPDTAKPKLLSGGNPQIPKGDGDAPVQTYIAAMPGWKQEVGQRLDALIVRTVPNVRKAVRWNTPHYGIEDGEWFLGFHCAMKYVKVAFFRGTSLHPLPPVASKQKEVRYLHIHEDDEIDEELMGNWIRQASDVRD